MATASSTTSVAELTGSRKRSRRLAAILDAVAEQGEISLHGLRELVGGSIATVRRDLTVLADQGLLVRTHGGAKATSSVLELPVDLRDTRFQEAKRRIARAAVALVPRERHAVALSGGSTTAGVARELAHHSDLTVVTNSLSIASLVAPHPRLKVVMTGGILRAQSLELVGVLAEGTFSAVNIGTAILGADGVSAEAGITTHDETEARTNHAMVASARRTIVVADGSKIGRTALAQMCPADLVHVLITDDSADPAELDRLRASGVEIIVVAAGEETPAA
ncbi:DeoR/GlpR family DNA-binding transcription regulator [Herbiconiux sp. KACC 21604]|uniref:DeoR/GlpR family DNA-binding transcription regulator n=1 Tax=unclassified Herbiconiux TaxID=2618217 RepID=UPI0020A46197|nr:DeoR/GlpR family DNA-binding transcription regulator [Herbiconiux sp. SALV-R1]WPO85872.1 DeoR/GlpR family DNA-binding transcription regulator [Herbiconiux sp. KACC 21604]